MININRYTITVFAIAGILFSTSCGTGKKEKDTNAKQKPRIVKKYYDSGKLKSASQVNSQNFIHGLKVNYYEDGKTVHSKISYDDGRKHGPALWYYKNGQVFEHTGFEDNLRQGPTKKYYKSGALMAEYSYDKDLIQPGLKEYHEDGSLINDYPDIKIREINRLKEENKLFLEISCEDMRRNVRYYKLVKLNDRQYGRSDMDSERGLTRMEFYVLPGNVLNKTIEFYAEIPTELGNYYIKKVNYQINVMNL